MAENEGFVSVVGGWQCQKCAMVVADPYKPRHEHGDADPEVVALALHFEVDPISIEQCHHSGNTFECEHEPGEYRVLTESERESAADDALESYIDECIIEQAKAEARDNAALTSLVKVLSDHFDRAAWKREALVNDGYGHTLSPYDGEEHEVKIGDTWYYIYRVN